MRIPLITKYLEEKNMEYQNALLEKQVQEVQNIYLTMRGWRHDYHNHLQAMKAYVKMGQYDRLEEYLGLLEQDLDHVNQLIETGNVNLDAILNSKISLAQKNGIEIDYQAKCPEALAVSDIDLCALIGNLLDNAVESCEKLTTEKPFIRLYIGVLKKQLYISVSNATNETVRKMDSEYISKKRGNHHPWKTREEYWGYLATFLHTTQTAPVRHPYLDLDALLEGKDFFILTTNQDTQFVKLYPEAKVAEIQGDHRFFQCAACCTDDTWDAVKPVADMMAAMGDGTKIPTDLIPRCPHCGGEAFPWVRGYGNFLQGKKYEEQYEKISRYVLEHKDSKILFLELGVGRMTPMFIQEPFWNLTLSFPQARYIAINNQYDFLPKQLEDKGMTIVADIAQVLRDARDTMDSGDNDR